METFTDANKIEIQIYDALKDVIDPELGINIIDMGLIYKIEYNETEGIKLEMTFSSKGCPMGDTITNDITSTLNDAFPDIKLNIQTVWDPVWTSDFITPKGKELLGM